MESGYPPEWMMREVELELEPEVEADTICPLEGILLWSNGGKVLLDAAMNETVVESLRAAAVGITGGLEMAT